MLGVHDFGMELNAVHASLGILEGGHRCVLRRRDHDRAGGRGDDGVTVRHPHGLILGQRREQLATRRAQLRASELGDVGSVDPPAELEREQLGAVADTERRDPELEQRRIESRRPVAVDGCRPTGEDQRARVSALQLFDRQAVRDELRVHVGLADPPCDQLRVLPAEVDHQHRPLLDRGRRIEQRKLSRVGNWARPS